ncbi:hypothetical protein [Paenirhodobacter sp. CAU 1674]|uniref:hypothetical protein n=1 Tax=Paenirhodobacter sp. CAU 1674 TaxID=3032596 RepID=UPI0023D9FD97|nr:hypothetical protein [Paenirhodobacter sp. CAU 1674]MDF2142922.1 hypothetical protein [Paenirhodobacter sp. CAU 1674]
MSNIRTTAAPTPLPLTEPTAEPARPMADFDWQIAMLWTALGGSIEKKFLCNLHLATLLELSSQAGITNRRSGTVPLSPLEATAIIKGYQLNHFGLDGSLFDLRDPQAFEAELRAHGIGVYDSSRRIRLLQRLYGALASQGLSIEILRDRRDRGLSYVTDRRSPYDIYHVSERVRLRVTGRKGAHVALIQVPQGTRGPIDTLWPSAAHPDTELTQTRAGTSELIVPGYGQDAIEFRPPSDFYRLLAVEGDAELIALFSCGELARAAKQGFAGAEEEDTALGEAPPRMTEVDAGTILAWLDAHPDAPLRVAQLEYLLR